MAASKAGRAVPSEDEVRAREWLVKQDNRFLHESYMAETVIRLAAEFRAVRLAEAKWWHTRVAMVAVAGGDDGHEIRTETRQRIAELEKP
jgi:hypothetical protein